MKQTDISSSTQLDAKLALLELNERNRLWRLAEGRFGWPVIVAGFLPVLILVFGLAIRVVESGLAGFIGKDPSGYFIVLGLALLGLSLWGNTQRQIGAMRVLLRDLERSRS